MRVDVASEQRMPSQRERRQCHTSNLDDALLVVRVLAHARARLFFEL